MSLSLNVTKRGAGIFSLTIPPEECELTSDIRFCGCLERKKAILKRSLSKTVSVSMPFGGKENKGTKVLGCVPAWGPPPLPDTTKHFRGVTVLKITGSRRCNGQSCVIREQQPLRPYHKDNPTVPYSQPCRWRQVRTASRCLWLPTSQG